MPDLLSRFLDTSFMPHGHCYQWRPEILWLHALSDGAIALAYFTIPFFLIYIVRKRRDIAFPWVFVMFGAFILLCGTTHVLEIYSIWHGAYVMTGTVKAVTGIVSLGTAVSLVPLVPRVLTLVGPGQLREANDLLRAEIAAREQAEERLRHLNEDLEKRVDARTAELARVNADLRRQVAEREEAERAVRDLNQTLEARVVARTEEIALSNTALEARNRDLQDFAHVASHDLQEPLRKIQSFAGILQHDEAPRMSPDGQAVVERLQVATARMSALVRDLLVLSRVGTQGVRESRVDLREVLDGVLTDLDVRIAETGARVEVGPLPVVAASATQMRQLFQNLIGNALKFHRPGVPPVVRVRAEPAPEGLRIVVEDNGIGFDEKHAARIFAPFQRLHSREAYEGTGIGLAIVRRIAERHGGTAAATSAPGAGATFVLTLAVVPAWPAPPGTDAAAPSPG